MEIKNRKYIGYNLWQQEYISNFMPKSNLTETVSLSDCLGRRVAKDVFANQSYPSVALSAIEGKMLNIKEDITTVEQFKKIERDTVGALGLGEDPFVVKTENDFITRISPFIKIGTIANTVISTEQYLPWFNSAYLTPEKGDVLREIKKGQGVVEVGIDYKNKYLILNQDDIITNAKKALLRQAEVEQVIVYKNLRFAVLCVDYELEDLNKNFEFEYIIDCMQNWGYDFEVIKIKPFKSNPINRIVDDAGISTDFDTYLNNIKEVTHKYDYVVACGLANNSYFNGYGLLRTINDLMNIYTLGSNNQKVQFIGNHFNLFKGAARSPEIREDVKRYDEEGNFKGQKLMLYEDKAVMSYIPGYILDIIVNMHLLVKPTILQRMYRKPFLPEWKIAVLTHDHIFEIDEGYEYKILWAYATHTTYDERRRIVTKEIPEINIINVENERPDMLHFMKECNCFIPVMNTENELKAGDYLYYLEI